MSSTPRDEDGLRERNKRHKRVRLREAAAALFEEVGFEETTTRAIAARAGVAAGTIFLYAEDKTDLLFLVFHDDLEAATREAFSTIPARGALLDRLLHVFRTVAAGYGRHPRAARPFLGALPAARGRNAIAMNTLTVQFLLELGAFLEAAKARGEVAAEVETLVAAQNLFALYYFSLVTWVSGLATLETAIESTLRASFALQLRGFAPRNPPKKNKKGRSS